MLSSIVAVTMQALKMNDDLSKVIKDQESKILYEIFDVHFMLQASQSTLTNAISDKCSKDRLKNNFEYNQFQNWYIDSIMECNLTTLEVSKDVGQDKSNLVKDESNANLATQRN
jgi:GTP-sensing pleiotropic transcriptional regulator CodY